MDYGEADMLLQGRCKMRRKLANNTYLIRCEDRDEITEDRIVIRLHGTDVVTLFRGGCTMLTSGGWKTMTTKERLNRFGPVRIYSKRGVWHMQNHQGELGPFKDEVVIDPNGRVELPMESNI